MRRFDFVIWKLHLRARIHRERKLFRSARELQARPGLRALRHSWRMTRYVWGQFDKKIEEMIDRELITGDGTGQPKGIE